MAAEKCVLDRVLFIPSSRPPHRRDGPFASYEDRFSMVALACEADRRFEPSRLEEGPGVSYSIDTIERVRKEFISQPLYFLIGADAFADIHSWHRFQDVVNAVRFIVVSRPGAQYDIPPGTQVERLEEIHLPISSSVIRRNLAEGNADVDVPARVLQYIRARGLYR